MPLKLEALPPALPRPSTTRSGRILIVDDNPDIHDDFRKILRVSRVEEDTLDRMTREIFGRSARAVPRWSFALDSAYQGAEAVARVEAALAGGHPYSVVFLDVRMPPGWDGLETLEAIWRVDPRVHVVLCTAYSDYSWEEIRARVGESDRLLILKKPFHSSEVRQLAHSCVTKWRLASSLERRFADLEDRVAARTAELEAANANLRREMEERGRVERALRRAQRLEALGRLAAGLGHEINNPLTFLMASIEAIEMEIEPYRARIPERSLYEIDALLGTILVGAERIAQLVRNIKQFARPSGEPGEAVDVAAVLDDMSGTLGGAGADVRMSGQPMLVARRTEIELVLSSLLAHAARAVDTSLPPRRIQVTGRRDRNGDLVIDMTAMDSSAGQAERDALDARAEGRGQEVMPGLSICHAIVMGLDGSIDIHDTWRGSAITLRLPAARVTWASAPPLRS